MFVVRACGVSVARSDYDDNDGDTGTADKAHRSSVVSCVADS